MYINKIIIAGIFLLFWGYCGFTQNQIKKMNINNKIEELVGQMTLEEKVGQLSLNVGDLVFTGPNVRTQESNKFDTLIRAGKVTGIFNIYGAEYTYRLQKIAVEESRLKIPLLFGADVIHGFRTVFPIPLAEAASWDLKAIEQSARIAAKEATASGITFNFAPMVDITRDPRWGRVAEGAGEDPYLGSKVATARVKGFQGERLDAPQTLAACVKHFAAYGAPHGGRDYNTVDMSERMLREIYLPPYKAAVEAGVATLMTSFNELDGVPATGNDFLLTQILRKEWGFDGMVVSDWQSILEMKVHGVGETDKEVVKMALEAGTDMDMEANLYRDMLPDLVKEGEISMEIIDRAVKRVLKVKFDLGLFDDPYKYHQVEREKKEVFSKENRQKALDVAKRCIVLLKNEKQLLPLSHQIKKLAVIGPLANNQIELNGTWSFFAKPHEPISILTGIKEKVGRQTEVLYAQGCGFYDEDQTSFEEAVDVAQKAEVVIMALGESAVMNGEGASRSLLNLPGTQKELLRKIHKMGKPIILLITSGRPLCIEWESENIPAILQTWTLGTETGTAIAEVLFGSYNPSGKLPVSFPRNVGQIPVYYNHKNTGCPYSGNYKEPASERVYFSKYRDIPNTPLYPFGYGLSYTTFRYNKLELNRTRMGMEDTLEISVKVRNQGKYGGEEVVQLYIRDLAGSVTRPVKELKGFKKLYFDIGETKKVTFKLTKTDFSFFRRDMTYGAETGRFKVFVGTNSEDLQEADFEMY